jgi:hypothetical protein
MRKIFAALSAACLVGVGLMASATGAFAADGDQALNVNFEGGVSTLSGVGATTDFSQTTLFSQASHPGGDGSMWDSGTYVIGTNPNTYHPLWVNWAGATDNMLFVNGFESTNQKVLEVSVPGVVCETAGSNVTYTFAANMVNILPLDQFSTGGAEISVYINGTLLGGEVVLSNDPSNVIEIVGSVPASDPMTVTIVNNGTAHSGNDFAIDDITLTQNGECEPPCEPTVNGVWFNYTGKYTGTGAPALNDPKWHALPAQPGGQHDLSVRGFNLPYNPGADKGKGDWFVWKDLGTTCPVVS